MQSLILPDQILNEIDNIMFKFIWQKRLSNKKVIEKIKRKTMCLDIDKGGLNMISAKDQQQVFCVKWIAKVAKESNSPAARLANTFLSKVGGIPYIIKSSLSNPEKMFDTLIVNWFWRKAAAAWSLLHYKMSGMLQSNSILSQPIFFNSHIQYKNCPLVFPIWINSNVLFLCDIIEKNCLKNERAILHSMDNYGGFILDYNALKNAVHTEWITNVIPKISNEDLKIAVASKWEITILETKSYS